MSTRTLELMEYDEFLSTNGVNITIAAAASTPVALPAGRWEIMGDVDHWIKRGTDDAAPAPLGAASVASGEVRSHIRYADILWYLKISHDDVRAGVNYISVVRIGAVSGTLYCRSTSR